MNGRPHHLSVKDFVELILPGVVSLVLGAMAAIVIPMLRRSATLRRQLEADASIVQQLADQAAIDSDWTWATGLLTWLLTRAFQDGHVST